MKQKLGSLLYCVLQAIVGILLLVNPISFTSGIIMAIGVVLTVVGAAGIIRYFRTPVEEAAVEQTLTRALLTLLAGLFGIFGSGWLIGMFPMVTILYGLLMLVIGVSKIQFVTDALRRKEKRWLLGVISAVITITCAAVVIRNPFSSTTVLWMFTGIAIIVDAVFDLIAVLFVKNEKPEGKPTVKEEVIIDAEA